MRLPEPITSRSNAKVKALRAAFSGKASRSGELVGIEGLKAILEAVKAGLQFDTVAISRHSGEEHTPERIASLKPREVLVLTDDVMATVVDTVSLQTIVATVVIPREARQALPSGIFLLLENIQDPGNLGTLIRSAEAFGVERVYLSAGCANLWSPKVIRSSAGSVFRQPASRVSLQDTLAQLQDDDVRLVGAVVRREGARVSLAADLAAPVALLIGNEGSGLSEDLLSRVQEKVYVPCMTESLNAAVAGSVLLYEVVSQIARREALRLRSEAGTENL